jgi:hypothetical protein
MVLDNGGSDENITKVKRARDGRVAGANHWEGGAVAHNDGGGKNRGGDGHHTRVGGDVG